MRMRDFQRAIAMAITVASERVSALSRGGGRYASGLASEGYDAGYAEALRDVDALVRYGHPADQRGVWREARKRLDSVD